MKTIHMAWIQFKHKNVPANASKETVANLRYTFYNGVAAILDGFIAASQGEIKDPDKVMYNWMVEMNEFGEEMKSKAQEKLNG